ncbi:hypothetical protein [Parabacteroides gordonii]|uniref:HK97 gp10 family phage protein n=1 Tax=Parabacteroides gordonii MS-1 = DSM 23371 TaxID=1203610 RepID=A0A0F5JDP1_9BACT|nr:hypothetical protein [Parabacteroides gordonii]KKB55552.1 hypothetical protein HMPREF1536_03023 [Parabacteroides gordonii MS-1 = DSM 23371]MCA5581661.1 hypothetical protein [Parabacteroides gordonii]RGP18088.1 hypothetical protein DXB27_01290 [Parabacteroides gordonii]
MSNVDAKQVLQMFAELDSKRQKKVHRDALKKATGILLKEVRKNFRTVVKKPNSRNRWNGKTFSSGIKSSINKEVTEGKVHILGDFRLKFFELGTKVRYKRTVRATTGKITASYFFKRAREAKETEISSSMNNIITQSIQKVNEKFRGR